MEDCIKLSKLSNEELDRIGCIKINGTALCGICGKSTSVIRIEDRTPICGDSCIGKRKNPKPFELWKSLSGATVQVVGIAEATDIDKETQDPVLAAYIGDSRINVYKDANGELEVQLDDESEDCYVIIQIMNEVKVDRFKAIKLSEFMGRNDSDKYNYTLENNWRTKK